MKYHGRLNVRGFIRNNRYPDGYRGVFRHDDGRSMTPDEAHDALLDELKKGREVIPLGECDNFDYAGGGCQGHPEAIGEPWDVRRHQGDRATKVTITWNDRARLTKPYR